MGSCCGQKIKFDGISADYKRRLWVIIVLNASMFCIEMSAGHIAKSQALQADALDFFADAITYGLSLAVIGASVKTRVYTALLKSLSLFLMGLWVCGSTAYQLLILDVPQANIMGVVSILALLTNLLSVLLLMKYKNGDSNVRSVWLCSRNDAIGNIAVMIAAIAVWLTQSGSPDLLVAGIMAWLFLSSSMQILEQAVGELKEIEAAKEIAEEYP